MAVQFYAQIYRKLFLYKKKKVAFIKKKTTHTHEVTWVFEKTITASLNGGREGMELTVLYPEHVAACSYQLERCDTLTPC